MEPLRTVILPVLLIAVVVAVSLYLVKTKDSFQGYLTYEGYDGIMTSSNNTGSNVSSNTDTLASSIIGIMTPSSKNAIGSNTGNNTGSNISSNVNASSIFGNILSNYSDKIFNSTNAELVLDINYDGREQPKQYTSEEHQQADNMQEADISRRDVKYLIKNELMSNLGRTTANQMYFDDDDSDNDNKNNNCTPATMQGVELMKSNKDRKCGPAAVDMSQYVRKDSIPCWGCDIE
jgi:hypothetical protein